MMSTTRIDFKTLLRIHMSDGTKRSPRAFIKVNQRDVVHYEFIKDGKTTLVKEDAFFYNVPPFTELTERMKVQIRQEIEDLQKYEATSKKEKGQVARRVEALNEQHSLFNKIEKLYGPSPNEFLHGFFNNGHDMWPGTSGTQNGSQSNSDVEETPDH